MVMKNEGSIKIILAVLVVILLFAAYIKFKTTNDIQVDTDEFGRVVDKVKENPKDEDVLRELDESGQPFSPTEHTFELPESRIEGRLLPTENYSLGKLSFKYPPILEIASTGTNSVSLKHTIDSPEHSDFCNLKDATPSNLKTIDDFDVKIQIIDKPIVQVFKEDLFDYQGISFFNKYIVDDEITNYDDFIKGVITSVGQGFEYRVAVEGCGQDVYVVELEDEVTLVFYRQLIPYLNPNSVTNSETYLSLDGVILPEDEDRVFKTLLASIKYNVR